MNIILSLFIALAIAIGAPVAPTSQPSQQPSQQGVCMEDDPCFDSATMGQQRPRMTDSEIDAWERVSALGIYAATGQTLDYIETLDHAPTALPLGYFTVASRTQPNTYHVMHWVTLSYA